MILRFFPVQGMTYLLLLVFGIGTAEIPSFLLHRTSNPRTCCGRPVCQCTHPKGALCPLKQQNRSHQELHGNHPSKSLLQSSRGQSPAKQPVRSHKNHAGMGSKRCLIHHDKTNRVTHKPAQPVFKKAPCHSEKSPSAHPPPLKEFLIQASSSPVPSFSSSPLCVFKPLLTDFLLDRRVKKPPQIPIPSLF